MMWCVSAHNHDGEVWVYGFFDLEKDAETFAKRMGKRFPEITYDVALFFATDAADEHVPSLAKLMAFKQR